MLLPGRKEVGGKRGQLHVRTMQGRETLSSGGTHVKSRTESIVMSPTLEERREVSMLLLPTPFAA